MLNQYRADLNNLLQNPPATTSLYPTASLDRFINIARGQIAAEGKCVRLQAPFTTTNGVQTYSFTTLNTGTPSSNGIQDIIHIRSLRVTVGGGAKWLDPHAWEWFNFYYLNQVVPATGRPTDWAQYGQGAAPPGLVSTGVGSAGSGTLSLYPIPDAAYTITADCVCYPQLLTVDTDVEAIPYLWTDCVPFFAAYYALLSSQTSARQTDAERMYKHYQTFLQRAREAANPDVMRGSYEQAADPAQLNKLGVRTPGSAGAAA